MASQQLLLQCPLSPNRTKWLPGHLLNVHTPQNGSCLAEPLTALLPPSRQSECCESRLLVLPPSKPHHVLHANVIMSRDRMPRLRKDLVRPGFGLLARPLTKKVPATEPPSSTSQTRCNWCEKITLRPSPEFSVSLVP